MKLKQIENWVKHNANDPITDDEIAKVIYNFIEQFELKITPKPYTTDFMKFLLVTAVRNLTDAQFHDLAVSMVERDSLRQK